MPKTCERVKLILQASNLPSFGGFFSKKPSPYAKVKKLAALGSSEKSSFIGRTETIDNVLNPQWTTNFILEYDFVKELNLEVTIFDDVTKKPIAFSRIEVGSILGRRHSRAAIRMNPSGTLYAFVAKIDEPKSTKEVQFQLESDLRLQGKVYFEVQRKDSFDSGALWTPIYRSDRLPFTKELGPSASRKFEVCSIPLNDLAIRVDKTSAKWEVDSDPYGSALRIVFWDFHKIKRHHVVGILETTVAGLMDACVNKMPLKLKKDGEDGVNVTNVVSITIIGDDETEAGDRSIPQDTPEQPTFLDYVNGTCELDLSVAIDFTASNGNPMTPGTPHYIDKDSLNEYEKAIYAIGSIVQKYDSDKLSQVWGFGAKYDNVVRNAFQVGDESHLRGVKGILEGYRNTFKRGIRMSGPVDYTKVIEIAAKQASLKLDTALERGAQCYSILLILTHGSVNDVKATKAVLKKVVDAPLSIILVGIGENDFSAMEFLDDFHHQEGCRDICNFVKFDSTMDPEILQSEALNEVPAQLSSYFITRGIYPINTEEEDQMTIGSGDSSFMVDEDFASYADTKVS